VSRGGECLEGSVGDSIEATTEDHLVSLSLLAGDIDLVTQTCS